MLKSNKLFLGGLVCLLSVGLTACVLRKPIPEDIIGLWVERRPTSRVGSYTPCASFSFSAGGRFEVHNIPREYFTFPGPRIGSASGSWQLDTSSTDPFALRVINLTFDRSTDSYAFESRLLISTDGRERILFAWYGDESNRITFVKRNKVECIATTWGARP